MKTIIIMVVFFRASHGAGFDVEQFDTMEQCEAAKAAIVEMYEDSWRSKPSEDNVVCKEVTHD